MLKRYPRAFTIPFVAAATFAAWGLLPGTAFAEPPPRLIQTVERGRVGIIQFRTGVPVSLTSARLSGFLNEGGAIDTCESLPLMGNGLALIKISVGQCVVTYDGTGGPRSSTEYRVTARGRDGGTSEVSIWIEVLDSQLPYLDTNISWQGELSSPVPLRDPLDIQYSPLANVDVTIPFHQDSKAVITEITECTLESWTGNIANPFTVVARQIPFIPISYGCRITGTIPRNAQGALSFDVIPANRSGRGPAVHRRIVTPTPTPTATPPTLRSLTGTQEGNGTISCDVCVKQALSTRPENLDLIPNGTTVTLTARADTGYVFMGWQSDCEGASASCRVTMNRDRTVRAVFGPRIIAEVTPGVCSSPAIGLTLSLGKHTGTRSNACFKYVNASSTRAVTNITTANNNVRCGALETRVDDVALCVTHSTLGPGSGGRAAFVAEVSSVGPTCQGGFRAAGSPSGFSPSTDRGKTANKNLLCLRRPSP